MNSVLYNSPRAHGAPYPYSVLAAGRSRFTPQNPPITTRFNEHTLILTIDGTGDIATGGENIRTEPHMVSWVDTSSGYSHGCARGSNAWDYLWFSFEGHASDQLYAKLARHGQLHVLAEPEAMQIFNLVLSGLGSNHPGRHAHLSSLVAQSLALFENSPRQMAFHSSLQQLAHEIINDLAGNWNTGTMAGKAGLSVSRFHAVFREEFGNPPATWVREQRLNAAKRLLTETDIGVAKIGERCGYPDPHHFSREFCKNVLLPPLKFRARMRSRVAR